MSGRDDQDSETSSVCSERSLSRFESAELTESLRCCSSTQWGERKEGLAVLQNYFKSGKVFRYKEDGKSLLDHRARPIFLLFCPLSPYKGLILVTFLIPATILHLWFFSMFKEIERSHYANYEVARTVMPRV